jgi:uncharacterized protein YjiS (DUF1127 family)
MSNAKLSLNHAIIAGSDEHYSSFGDHLQRWLTVALDRLLDHLEQRRELAALARMDDRSLKDIGLTRTDLARSGNQDRV